MLLLLEFLLLFTPLVALPDDIFASRALRWPKHDSHQALHQLMPRASGYFIDRVDKEI